MEQIKPYIAGFWRRTFAFIIDISIVSLACYIISYLCGHWAYAYPVTFTLLGLVLVVSYYGVLNSKSNLGQTIGKKILSIQVVDSHHQHLSLTKSFFRAFILFSPFCLMSLLELSNEVFAIILALVLTSLLTSTIYLDIFNKRNRRITHDFAVKSYVVNCTSDAESPKSTWSIHFWILAVLITILNVSTIWAYLDKDQTQSDSSLNSKIKINDLLRLDHYFDNDEDNPSNMEHYYYAVIGDPALLNNPSFAEELALHIKNVAPENLKANQKNHLILLASYQFGFFSRSQSNSYEIHSTKSGISLDDMGGSYSSQIGGGY